jgi:hypothetical protein
VSPQIRKCAWIAVLPFFFLISGCNKIRLGYEYGDWLVMFSIKGSIDPDRAQLEILKQDVEDYFLWNRRAMLPRYADFLQGAVEGLRAGANPDQYDSAYRKYRRLYRETLVPVVDKAQNLLLSLSPGQIDAYAKRLKKKNDKLRKDFRAPMEELRERRYRKTLAGIEDWTGRLGSEQRSRVREMSLALPWNGGHWLDNREKSQAEMLGILRGSRDSLQLRRFLEDYFLHPENLRSPEFQSRYAEYENGIRDFILGLFAVLTPRQKERVFSQLEALARDFRKMSRDG